MSEQTESGRLPAIFDNPFDPDEFGDPGIPDDEVDTSGIVDAANLEYILSLLRKLKKRKVTRRKAKPHFKVNYNVDITGEILTIVGPRVRTASKGLGFNAKLSFDFKKYFLKGLDLMNLATPSCGVTPKWLADYNKKMQELATQLTTPKMKFSNKKIVTQEDLSHNLKKGDLVFLTYDEAPTVKKTCANDGSILYDLGAFASKLSPSLSFLNVLSSDITAILPTTQLWVVDSTPTTIKVAYVKNGDPIAFYTGGKNVVVNSWGNLYALFGKDFMSKWQDLLLGFLGDIPFVPISIGQLLASQNKFESLTIEDLPELFGKAFPSLSNLGEQLAKIGSDQGTQIATVVQSMGFATQLVSGMDTVRQVIEIVEQNKPLIDSAFIIGAIVFNPSAVGVAVQDVITELQKQAVEALTSALTDLKNEIMSITIDLPEPIVKIILA